MVECPICFDSVHIPSCIKPCDHMFCHKCISKWLKRCSNCPLCRTKCDMDKFKIERDPVCGYFSSDKELYMLTRIMGIR